LSLLLLDDEDFPLLVTSTEGERLRVIVRVSGDLGSISIASLVLGRSEEVVAAAEDDDMAELL